MAKRWVPRPKVGWAAIVGPIVVAVASALATDPFDWKLPASALVTAIVAYLVPDRGIRPGRVGGANGQPSQ